MADGNLTADQLIDSAPQCLERRKTERADVHSAVRVIEPHRSWFRLDLKELWAFRELIWILAWRDVSVRYKQTFVGAAWAVAQPLAMMLVFSVVFRRWAHMPSQGVPYPLFAFVALLPWQYFSTAMSSSAGSLLRSSNLLSKVYFPRLAIPIAAVLPPLVDLLIAFGVLMVMLAGYGIQPSWRWLLLPCVVLLTVLMSLAVGIWVAALSVEYRDFAQLMPFITQLWMFASPVVYPPDLVSFRWQNIYVLNPMTGIIDSFRWIILGTTCPIHCNIVLSVAIIIGLLISGIIYFQHMERTFADLI
jgi:lipopolysaccharide transport system permease protein